MASHRPDELREAAQILATTARTRRASTLSAPCAAEVIELERTDERFDGAEPRPAIFDFEQTDRLAA